MVEYFVAESDDFNCSSDQFTFLETIVTGTHIQIDYEEFTGLVDGAVTLNC